MRDKNEISTLIFGWIRTFTTRRTVQKKIESTFYQEGTPKIAWNQHISWWKLNIFVSVWPCWFREKKTKIIKKWTNGRLDFFAGNASVRVKIGEISHFSMHKILKWSFWIFLRGLEVFGRHLVELSLENGENHQGCFYTCEFYFWSFGSGDFLSVSMVKLGLKAFGLRFGWHFGN